MIIAPEGFTRAIESGNRDYRMLITCTLASGTILTIDNTRVWSSGFSYEDSLSTTPDMLEIGTAIINKVTLVINNMDEHYSAYDFGDAVLEVQIGLRPDGDDSSISYITKGIYTVDSASYNTMLITLTALDNMYKFDRLYGTVPSMPSTALALVQSACSVCGVTLGVQTFDGADTAVTVPPTADTTYRQMLAWIGQMIGCDWRINTSGELMPVWFNIESLGKFYDGGTFNYNDGAVLDGGTFAYNDGDDADGGAFNDSGYFVISSLATANVAVDDTVITGVVVRVLNDVTEEEAPTNAFTEYTTGQEGFRVVVENNPEITEGNVQTVLSTLGGRLIGMKYRKGQLMHLSDPRLEAGDVFVYADHKDHAYPMICSQTMFALGQYQTTTSASAVPIRKAAERYGVQTQTTVQIYKSVLREKTSREEAEADLQEQIDNAPGLYQTVQSDGQGGSIYLLHNKPTVAESAIVWKMSSTAFGVSTNGGQSYNAGLTADGTAIVQRLYANTITAGILQSPDYAYSSGVYSSAGMLVDLANNIIRTPSFAVVGGNTYISASLTLGGQNNTYGTLTVLDASGNTIGTWKNDGIRLYNSSSQLVGQFAVGANSETQIGASNTSHIYMDYHSLQLIDINNVTYFHVSDLRDRSGLYNATDEFDGDGITKSFVFGLNAIDYQTCPVYVDDVEVTSGITRNSLRIIFDSAPLEGSVVRIEYQTSDYRAKAYTMGIRVANSVIGVMSVAIGYLVTASGKLAIAEGNGTIASGRNSHAEGHYTTASGQYSHAQNYYTVARGQYQTVIGKYNVEDTNNTFAFIIGNGTESTYDYTRSNAFTVDWNGNVFTAGQIRASSSIGTGSKSAWNDTTNTGIWLTGSSGQIHLSSSTTNSGGSLNFHFNKSATTTSAITEPESGVLRISGSLRVQGHSSAIGTRKSVTNDAQISVSAQTATAIASISIEAGTWLLIASASLSIPSSATYIRMNISSTSGNDNAQVQYYRGTNANTRAMTCTTVTVSATTTMYFNVYTGQAGTIAALSVIFQAVRIA